MKNITIKRDLVLSLTALSIIAVSCNKENSVAPATTTTTTTTATQSAITASSAIAVAASSRTAGSSSKDSIYVIHTCAAHSHPDSIAFSSLPSSVTTYLTANYAGYTPAKAYTIKDTTGTLQGYIAIITYNSNPVGLKFDASGNFVSVLEQREGQDLNGPGWHHGGHFEGRDNLKKDTIALSALPQSIVSYFKSNYPSDTLAKAYKNADGSIVVLSINNGVFATVFNASGTFVTRIQMPAPPSTSVNAVEQSALPAASLSYLTSTYPNYVFKRAYKVTANNIAEGYVVIIDANNTKYAVAFDASGKFISVKTIW